MEDKNTDNMENKSEKDAVATRPSIVRKKNTKI